MTYEIRTAVEADFPDVYDLYAGVLEQLERAYPEQYRLQKGSLAVTPEYFTETLEDEDKELFLAISGGKIAAFLEVTAEYEDEDEYRAASTYGWVEECGALPGHGAALPALLEHTEAWCKKQGYPYLDFIAYPFDGPMEAAMVEAGYQVVSKRLRRPLV